MVRRPRTPWREKLQSLPLHERNFIIFGNQLFPAIYARIEYVFVALWTPGHKCHARHDVGHFFRVFVQDVQTRVGRRETFRAQQKSN